MAGKAILISASLMAAVSLGFAADNSDQQFNKQADVSKMVGDIRSAEHRNPGHYGDHGYYGDPGYYHDGRGYLGPHYPRPHYPRHTESFPTTSTDCEDLYVTGGEMQSRSVFLTSVETIRVCDYYDDDYDRGHGRGGYNRGYYENCYDRTIRSYSKNARILFSGQRNLNPWETEKFRVCLNGNNASLDQRIPAYNYVVNTYGGYEDVEYQLTPAGMKKPMKADPNGLSAGSFTRDGNSFQLALYDKWAEYYKGEKIQITIQLRRQKGDSGSLFKEQTFEFDTASQYSMDFTSDIKPGQFYAQWYFIRIGQVSTREQVEGGKSGFIQIP
ncbi:MAG: hypothetical protein HY551_02130 [Elusimicrobia bacterium]|nr:hypothetical protein [Elusimicrobiota bacterium]